jgi:glycosyltransferase involved in cell wall biosynthesis
MMITAPKISVLMAVHNGEKYLGEAIDSILSQSFGDFELIIIDDASEDATPDIIRGYGDARIVPLRIVRGGLVTALNHGFAHARGEYIARMDADDRAMANRFSVQAAFLDDHQDIDIVCSDIFTIDAEGMRSGEQVQHGFDNDMLRDGLLGRRPMKPIIHPSVMMRRRMLEDLGGYRHFLYAEDHDLWMRAVDRFAFARIEQFLLEYRIYGGGVSRTKGESQAIAAAMSATCYLINKQTGVDVFVERPDDFLKLSNDMGKRLRGKILPPKLAFRNARLEMLNGMKLKGMVMLALTLLRYGRNALPGTSDRLTASLVTEFAQGYSEETARAETGRAA